MLEAPVVTRADVGPPLANSSNASPEGPSLFSSVLQGVRGTAGWAFDFIYDQAAGYAGVGLETIGASLDMVGQAVRIPNAGSWFTESGQEQYRSMQPAARAGYYAPNNPGVRVASFGAMLMWPSRAVSGAVATTIRGGIGPVLKGQAGVARAIAEYEAAGGRVLGKEISLRAGGGMTRPDFYGQNAQGVLEFIEVKTGAGAALNANQARLFPIIQTSGAVPVGANAALAGLTPGVPISATPVRILSYP